MIENLDKCYLNEQHRIIIKSYDLLFCYTDFLNEKRFPILHT